MSTRGHVAVKENGEYTYIYNHSDSYIEGLGITLFKHYNNAELVRALVGLGNTSSIYNTIENTATSYREHINRDREERGTVANFRDSQRWADLRDYDLTWDECKPIVTDNINEVLGEAFTYIYDVDASKWLIACDEDHYRVRDLETVLHSKELLESLFSERYIKEYLPEFYEKCLSA